MDNNITSDIRRSFRVLTLSLFILTILLPASSATFTLGSPNYSISTVYGPSQNINGWINISFSNEPLSRLFESEIGSAEKTINLSEMLRLNPSYARTCSPLDCKDDYSVSSGAASKQATLNSGEYRIYGVRLTGNIQSINSFKFDLTSDAGASCINQIELDFLDDGVTDFKNTKSTDAGSCSSSKTYGCFNPSQPLEDVTISASSPGPVCERINLSDSPGFVIGAWLKKTGATGTVKAAIYKKTGEETANCNLPDASASGGEVSCNVGYAPLGTSEHYVCIYLSSETGDYQTKGYTSAIQGNRCGFYGTPIKTETSAFQIFAEGKQFDSVGTINANKSLADDKSFAEKAGEYILDKYGSFDCTAGCIIPIKVKSNVTGQSITLNNLQVNYQKEFGTTETTLYDVSTTPARINSGFQRLYLTPAGFAVPSSQRNYTFVLKFNNDEVLSQKIEIRDIPIIQSVTPSQAAAGFPQEFVAKTTSSYNISSFSWNFGDNSSRVTIAGKAGNTTTHTYTKIGTYTLTINVTDSRGLTGTTAVQVNVTSPRDLIEINLAKLKASVSNIKTDISSFDLFSRQAINSSLRLAFIETSVNSLQTRYNTATETQLPGIVTEILALGTLPESIAKTRSAGGLPFISAADDVNVGILESIAGGTASNGSEEDYANAVAFWPVENLATTVDFNEFSGEYANTLTPVVKTFKITTKEIRNIGYDYYLIMPELSGFYSDTAFSNESGYIYINLKDHKTVSFSTTENVDFTNLPAFISPSVIDLAVETTTPPEDERTNKWLIFGLVIVALLVIGTITYIVLQQWYKRKYENHLFPNRNDLYNMAHYIHNAKRKGMSNSEIESHLSRAGWSGERIRYAMRKYAGKRTGMLEIPITKIVGKIEEKAKK